MNHDNHNHEEHPKIYLTLEDDQEIECTVVADIELEAKVYLALLPEDEERVLLYEYQETEEGPLLLTIEDDGEFDRVSDAYNAMMEKALKKSESSHDH